MLLTHWSKAWMSRAGVRSFWPRPILVYSVALIQPRAGRSFPMVQASIRGPVVYLRMRNGRRRFGLVPLFPEYWFLAMEEDRGNAFPESRQKLPLIRLP